MSASRRTGSPVRSSSSGFVSWFRSSRRRLSEEPPASRRAATSRRPPRGTRRRGAGARGGACLRARRSWRAGRSQTCTGWPPRPACRATACCAREQLVAALSGEEVAPPARDRHRASARAPTPQRAAAPRPERPRARAVPSRARRSARSVRRRARDAQPRGAGAARRAERFVFDDLPVQRPSRPLDTRRRAVDAHAADRGAARATASGRWSRGRRQRRDRAAARGRPRHRRRGGAQ